MIKQCAIVISCILEKKVIENNTGIYQFTISKWVLVFQNSAVAIMTQGLSDVINEFRKLKDFLSIVKCLDWHTLKINCNSGWTENCWLMWVFEIQFLSVCSFRVFVRIIISVADWLHDIKSDYLTFLHYVSLNVWLVVSLNIWLTSCPCNLIFKMSFSLISIEVHDKLSEIYFVSFEVSVSFLKS